MSKKHLCIAAVAVVALLVAPRSAADGFRLSSIGPARTFGVNAYGQAVGYFTTDGTNHGFMWQNGVLADVHTTTQLGLFHVFTENYSEVFAISDSDQIVGTARTKIKCAEETIIVQRAFIMRPAGTDFGTPYPGDALGDLGTFGHPCFVMNSAAIDISNNNHVVGWSDVTGPDFSNSGVIHAFIVVPINGRYAEDANNDLINDYLIDLGSLSSAEGVSSATGVNDLGEVVGYSYTANVAGAHEAYRAFLIIPDDTNNDGYGDVWFADANNDFANDMMIDLGTLGGRNSWARGINNDRQIVGESDTTDLRTRAFLWDNGVMTDLGTFGGNYSSASRINNHGHVVGWAETADGKRRAFLWKDGVMTDLNTFLPKESTIDLVEARDINDSGLIVGWGVERGSENGTPMGFVLTPKSANDEPPADSNNDPTVAPPPTSGGTSSGTTGDLDPLIPDPAPQQPAGNNGSDTDPNPTPTNLNLCGVGTAGLLPFAFIGLVAIKRRRA